MPVSLLCTLNEVHVIISGNLNLQKVINLGMFLFELTSEDSFYNSCLHIHTQ